jgi:hypothetical protein
MKKYTIVLALSLFAFIGVSNVFAGGGFDDVMLNPDGTIKTSLNTNGGATTSPTVGYGDAVDTSQSASAGSALSALATPTGVGIVIFVLIMIGGLIYWSYKNSTPKSY